jgi:hypothetical protein
MIPKLGTEQPGEAGQNSAQGRALISQQTSDRVPTPGSLERLMKSTEEASVFSIDSSVLQ